MFYHFNDFHHTIVSSFIKPHIKFNFFELGQPLDGFTDHLDSIINNKIFYKLQA